MSLSARNFPRLRGTFHAGLADQTIEGERFTFNMHYVYSIRSYLRRTCIGTIVQRERRHTYIATGSSDSVHPLPCTSSEQHKRNCCDRYLRIQVAQRAGTLCKAWRGRIRFHASFQQLRQIATTPCLENNSFSFRLEKSDGRYTCIQPLHLYFRRIANTASQNGIFPFLFH